jgi:3',5'-cyclic AMP phosphodiesterase CpdA
MIVTRVLVVSDSHLSTRTPEAVANWDAVVGHIDADRPDVVVHTGDVSTDGARHEDDLAFARDQLARSALPILALAGNHDLGDNPHPGRSGAALRRGGDAGPDGGVSLVDEHQIDAARLARYRRHLDPDRWVLDIPGWRLVGLNSMLFGSGLDEEAEQWDWFDERLADLDRRRRLALFVHKPLVASPTLPDDTAATSPGRYTPPAVARRLLAAGPRLVVSGHTHQFCRHRTDGATHVWVPSTWAVIPDRFQPVIGDKVCGVVELVLHEDGTCETELMLPYGIVQQAIVDDLPDPYHPDAPTHPR